MNFDHLAGLIIKSPKMTESVISMDPIMEAEGLLGKSFDVAAQENFGSALAAFMTVNELQQAVSRANGDTHYGASFDGFHELVSKYGFIVGYMDTYKCERNPNNWQSWCPYPEEREVLYYHPTGLVIYLNTYGMTGINRVELYAEFDCRGKKVEMVTALDQWSYGCIHDEQYNYGDIFHATLDCRQNMLYYLNRAMSVGTPVPVFTDPHPFFWFLTYSDEKFGERCDNRMAISMSKVKKGTAGLKKIFAKYL